jgi:hypothetical protein
LEEKKMGMFDSVIYEAPCYNCGVKLIRFQSKDGPCALKDFTPGQLVVVAGGDAIFYDYCRDCETMNYYLAVPQVELPVEVPVHITPKPSINDEKD